MFLQKSTLIIVYLLSLVLSNIHAQDTLSLWPIQSQKAGEGVSRLQRWLDLQ
jgi:hypothetical protein